MKHINFKKCSHSFHRDHFSMQLSPVKVTDALCCFLCGRHGDKAIATSTGTLDIGHHLGPDNLRGTIQTKRTREKTKNLTLKSRWHRQRMILRTHLAIFAEERLQISCPGGGGQATDPEVLARRSSASRSYMQVKPNKQTSAEGSEGPEHTQTLHLLTLVIFWLALRFFLLRATDRKTRSYKIHSGGDTSDAEEVPLCLYGLIHNWVTSQSRSAVQWFNGECVKICSMEIPTH